MLAIVRSRYWKHSGLEASVCNSPHPDMSDRPEEQTTYSAMYRGRNMCVSGWNLGVGMGCLSCDPHDMATKRIPMKDFFKNPQEANHQVSPDGKYISYLAPYERRLNVFIKPTAGTATRVTSETARD